MGKIIPAGLSIPADALQRELEMREHFRESVAWHGLLTPEAAEPIIQKAAKWSVLSDAAHRDATAAFETQSPKQENYADVDAYFAAYRKWLQPCRRAHLYSGIYIELLDRLFLSPKARFDELDRRARRRGFGAN